MKEFTNFTLLFVVSLALVVWQAYVGSILWFWFVTPIFGVTVPSLAALAGLLLIVRFAQSGVLKELVFLKIALIPDINSDTTKYYKRSIQNVIWDFLFPAGILFVGWIYTYFI